MKIEKSINPTKLAETITRFTYFVQYIDKKQGFISFRDNNSFLGKEEDYKSRIAEKAREELNSAKWEQSWIGTGKIAACAKKAMNKAANLVNMHQHIDFKNRLDPSNSRYEKDAERVLFDLYSNPQCEEADVFARAMDVFGAKYGTLAYLFFIKDDTRFLPISTNHFDKGFDYLGIDFTTSRSCTWDNYMIFVGIIREIYEVMRETLPIMGELRLIDAHSFVWVIQQDRFIDWIPGKDESVQIELETEKYLQNPIEGAGGKRMSHSNVFVRSAEVVKETRKRAKGICQYCRQPAPFTDKNGNPYLEVHHIQWLSRGGEDSTVNTVALCPNCHTRMHILDKPEDVELLKKCVRGI